LRRRRDFVLVMLVVFIALLVAPVWAQKMELPGIKVDFSDANNRQDVARSLQIVIIITILSLAPTILVMMTSFTRIVIVLSFLRHALGTQMIPPNQLLISFALFLTFFTMLPTVNKINDEALKPYMAGKISQTEAISSGQGPIKNFMLRQTRRKDLELFVYASGQPRPQNKESIPIMVLIPSFVLSELRTAFIMGFTLFITFLVIDMVVASILMSMGMFMLPPMMISLPLKIMLFVLVDGWYLVVKSLITSFR
jgi:flagellar biosynthesis protein FliP